MLWDEIATVQGWWEAEERCCEEFQAAGQLVRECMGDQGNGLYEFQEDQDDWYDAWKHCESVLEAISSLVRGW